MSQIQKIGKHATTIINTEHVLIVQYHDTDVVWYSKVEDKIVLDSGGWKTSTTKLRMNQASNQFDLGYHVFQDKGIWYVEFRNKTFDRYYDNMTFYGKRVKK